jgi:hypothetical protein
MEVEKQWDLAADAERNLPNQAAQATAGSFLDRAFEQDDWRTEFGPLAAHERFVSERSAGAQLDDRLEHHSQI